MSVSILEALQSADYNLNEGNIFSQAIGKDQLHNVVELFIKGYDLKDQVEPLLEKYGKVENVPGKKRRE